MSCPTWIRVVLWLAYLTVPAVGAVPYVPLTVPVALPEHLRGKAVWALCRLPDDRLAVGFEGGIALGVPEGAWTIVATPNGSPVQTIVAAHGRILVGGGNTGFVETGRFQPLDPPGIHLTDARAVPEGWLAAGPAGLWLVPPEGRARQLLAAPPNTYPALGRWRDRIVVLEAGPSALVWQAGQLGPAPEQFPAVLRPSRRQSSDLWFAPAGVFDQQGQCLLPAEAANALLDDAGLIGAVQESESIVCATFWHGLVSFLPGAAAPAWQWDGIGACYCAVRDGRSLLVGGSHGATAVESPDRVRLAPLDNADILHLEAAPGGARVVTLQGLVECGELPPSPPGSLWPAREGLSVIDGTLDLHDHAIRLPTRYINGLDTCGTTTAVAYDNTVLLVRGGATPPKLVSLPSSITSLAAHDSTFLVGTHGDGVHALAADGRGLEKIGTGRARVRKLGPARACLLFWNGDIREAALGGTFRLPLGNPRDAALVDVRLADGTLYPDQLAVLATRPDKPPLLAWFAGGRWQPLEVPGLAEIDAEMVAAADGRLQIAGRRGVVEIRMPLTPAEPPAPFWAWGGGEHTAQLSLASPALGTATLVSGRWEPPSVPATAVRLRLPTGAWLDGHPGVPLAVPVNWGLNELLLETERQGLVERRTLAVLRPYPWYLRPWAAALALATLAAALWALGRWRHRHLLRQKRALEAAVEQRTAQLRKANAAKEEFLASVSHEIRNPLNGVVGICAILQDSEIGPRERSFVRVLSGCAEQLRSMLDDVLDFSRIERGDLSLATTIFESGALVEEAVRAMDPTLAACTLQRPATPCWLEGDAGKIRQIVCNLVSNALKYGRPRAAKITVDCVAAPDQRARLRIAVGNTGPTIPADELPRLFESFRRGHGTDTTPGFGLGLAICRKLAERLGGAITATSTDGATEFALELALPLAAAPAPTPPAIAQNLRALAIEDEHYNRLALGHALKSLGYTADWAVDGATALQLARQQPYDLILTDWRLPDTDGDALCQRLRAILATPPPPIIAVTAYSSAEKEQAARRAGMAGFLTKPVTREKLAQLLRTLDTGAHPRTAIDRPPPDRRTATLALLGEAGPTLARLGTEVGEGWQRTVALARLRDLHTARSAHALRSLLLLAEERDLAEQFGLLEQAAEAADWETVGRLLPFLDEEITGLHTRLTAGPGG